MADININEYFRTNTGFIDKLNQYWLFNEKYKKLNIVKHSPNIIDLIEEGDYVNGEKVFGIEKDPFVKGQTDIFFNRDEVNYWGDRSLSQITDKDIKSIVTKEQFQSMEYRLEE